MKEIKNKPIVVKPCFVHANEDGSRDLYYDNYRNETTDEAHVFTEHHSIADIIRFAIESGGGGREGMCEVECLLEEIKEESCDGN